MPSSDLTSLLESTILPFFPFFFPVLEAMFLFVPCSLCSRCTGWGSRLRRPRISGLCVAAISGAHVSLQGLPLPLSWQLRRGDACSLESAVVQLRAGSLPLQMVRMTPWPCQASPMSPPRMWGPADCFFSPPEASFCCSLLRMKGSESAPCYHVTVTYSLKR